MTFSDLIKKRYSVRNYLDRPVEEKKLMGVLEAGRIAPSAANFQPRHIIVIRDKEMIMKIGAAFPRVWFMEAPMILVVCGDHEVSWKRNDGKDYTDIDIAILVDHMTLAAAEAGLGTCWVCNFDVKKVREVLSLPDNIEPYVLLPLGYPAKTTDSGSRHHLRHELDKIIHWEKF
jgi:nitroreductase